MNWFKKLFGIKEKPVKVEEVNEVKTDIPQSQGVRKERTCELCKQEIIEGDRWSKQQGKWFHRKCYKQVLKGF